MQNLSTLILENCSRIKAHEATLGLPKMKYLTYLNLCNSFVIRDGNTWVTNEVVNQIPNVEHFQSLNLGRTSITDEALPKIGTMCQLKSLCLDCNKLSGAGIANTLQSIAELQKLSVWGMNGECGWGSIDECDMEVLAR